MTYRLSRIKQIITGWINYYGIANMKSAAESLDGWLRRRIRTKHLQSMGICKHKERLLENLQQPNTFENTNK
jgi:hypothetical protein